MGSAGEVSTSRRSQKRFRSMCAMRREVEYLMALGGRGCGASEEDIRVASACKATRPQVRA